VNATLERVRARVAERFPADLDRIRDYLRLPSVSATGEGIRATAEATGAWIEGAGGYVGPGGKTIVPSRAVALVDIRLVPGGDPSSAAAAVRRHLDRHGFGHVEVRMLESYPWAKAPPGNRSELALRASYRALGRRPLPYPLAPWCAPYYVFDRILGLPWAAGGVGHAAGAHGPDEYATVAGLQEHVVGAAAFLLAYAAGAVEAPA
jgi:acetylornithine deacetylase/succinyl-diaminopimelate desuccinylase-like protein